MSKKGLTKAGKFEKGRSGNPVGRPAGSKNKITLMKLMAEEAVRQDNADAMQDVCRLIIEQATEGHAPSQKLVWDTVMSKGAIDTTAAKEKVEINIGRFQLEEKPIEGTVTIIEDTPNEQAE